MKYIIKIIVVAILLNVYALSVVILISNIIYV